jgi:putative sigma-54 modulation protein
MNINITFRHMETSEAIKNYARGKLSKLQKFLRQPMAAKVTLSLDKLRHVAETQISSGGAHLEAKEVGDDMYASIDRVIDKLERQIRGTKGVQRSKKRRGADSVRANGASVEAAAPTRPARAPAKKAVRTASAKKAKRTKS